MSATTTAALCRLSSPPSPHKLRNSKCSTLTFTNRRKFSPSPLFSVSSRQTPIVEQEQEQESQPKSSDDQIPLNSGSLTGCKACGREEMENGCNGEGRIQGGIATVPGFGWWPIKAYRPCPAFVATGGRYRRTGQSMDEVVSGNSGRGISDRVKSSKKQKKEQKESKGDV